MKQRQALVKLSNGKLSKRYCARLLAVNLSSCYHQPKSLDADTVTLMDNIPVERLWRTIKYEEVYLRTYETVTEAKQSLEVYINWYNQQRRHSGINYQRPYEVMIGRVQATSWPFQQPEMGQMLECGYVDNAKAFPHIPTSPTTTTKQQKGKITMDLSSKIAA